MTAAAEEGMRGRAGVDLPLACMIGGMDLLRAISLAGIPCLVAARPGRPARYSRSTREVIEWADPWTDPEERVERLVRFGAAQRERPVLYYNGDQELLLISRFRERLTEAFRFVVPAAELVEDLVDKGRFQTLAEKNDLPVPAAERVTPAVSTHADVALDFPLVLKPLTRRRDTWTDIARAKVVRLNSRVQLAELWPKLAAAEQDVLLQELVLGPESRVESYHVFVAEDGEILAEFTGRKIRTYPTEFGYSTAVVITEASDIVELGRDLVRRLGFRGVAKFDFKRGLDGRTYLFEVNPRFSLWHHPGARAGVNIPALVYRELAGLPRVPPPQARPGVSWCSLRDAQAARAQGIPLRGWLRWASTVEAKSVVSLRDPLPAISIGVHAAEDLLRARVRSLSRRE
jgi:D-aspartate ligase